MNCIHAFCMTLVMLRGGPPNAQTPKSRNCNTSHAKTLIWGVHVLKTPPLSGHVPRATDWPGGARRGSKNREKFRSYVVRAFWRTFWHFRVLFEVQNDSKIMKMHSRNALRLATSFRNRFSEISVRFSRSPDLKNRALAYTRARFSKNRRFRFRTSFWRDFWRFYLRFLPQKSIKTPPKTVSRKLRFSIAFFARFS